MFLFLYLIELSTSECNQKKKQPAYGQVGTIISNERACLLHVSVIGYSINYNSYFCIAGAITKVNSSCAHA